MKFFYFYNDLLLEARYYSDEKFNWVAQNIGGWILDSTIDSPWKIKALPLYNEFKDYLRSNTTKNTSTDDDMVLATDYIENFLNFLSPRDAQTFIKGSMEKFPRVKENIVNYLKPKVDTGVEGKRRGRPPGVKNKPKIDLTDPSIRIIKRVRPEEPVDVTKGTPQRMEPQITQPDVQNEPESEQPDVQSLQKRAGRPKLYDDNLTAFERMKYKKEGPGMIKSLEGKVESLNYEAEQIRQRILKIMGDIGKRKKYFGIE